jgi:hypothetical protein
MLTITLLTVILATLAVWWLDAALQVEIWRMADPDLKRPAIFHLYRVAILITYNILLTVALLPTLSAWVIPVVILVNVIGIIIYEFRFTYLAYGDWKFHKNWGYKIGEWKIPYPNWKTMILVLISSAITLGTIVNRLDKE